tara:strand:+ start:305 stop:499 length:195 start_codon:yes stop_codon:yes gene_type:complete
MKKLGIVVVIQVAIMLFLLVGWCKCVYKAINCNWEPIGKAEVIYTGGVLLGYGGIIGWINIEDK